MVCSRCCPMSRSHALNANRPSSLPQGRARGTEPLIMLGGRRSPPSRRSARPCPTAQVQPASITDPNRLHPWAEYPSGSPRRKRCRARNACCVCRVCVPFASFPSDMHPHTRISHIPPHVLTTPTSSSHAQPRFMLLLSRHSSRVAARPPVWTSPRIGRAHV